MRNVVAFFIGNCGIIDVIELILNFPFSVIPVKTGIQCRDQKIRD